MAKCISTHLNDEGKGRRKLEKTRIWVNCGQVANSIFAEQESGHFWQANRWSRLSPSGTPTARDMHTSVWCDVAHGMYVFGGSDGRGLNVNGSSVTAEPAPALHGFAEVNVSMTCTFSTAGPQGGWNLVKLEVFLEEFLGRFDEV